ncbi:MAG: sulfite exporter TauE/SafE family protein [Nitriliruptoraceae bacterium]
MDIVATTGIGPLVVVVLATVTAMLGAIGGLGGAVLLVPALVLLGWSPVDAAPLGMAMVAAGSFAAVPAQARSLTSNLRLGVVLETSASIGAAAGAVASALLAPRVLMMVLGVASIVAALAGGTRTGQRNLPVEGANLAALRDQPGTLASAYLDQRGRVVPYQVRRVRVGMGLGWIAGAVAGMTGTSGGYLKTPIMSEVMHVPVKVAAATTVFMAGVTAAVGLAIYAGQGRVTAAIAPAVLGGLIGGRIGAWLQPHLPAPIVRRALSVVLIVIGIIVMIEA